MSGEEERIATEVISASLGGAISASVLYPLEVLKTKLQAETRAPPSSSADIINGSSSFSSSPSSKKASWSMWQYAKYVADTEGYRVFIDGVETSAFQSAVEKALYFFAYTFLKQVWKQFVNDKPLNTATNLFLGCCAEWCHLPITLPLDCWTTYIQTQSKRMNNNNNNNNNQNNSSHGPLAMFLALLSEKGWAGLYKGWQAYYVLCFKPALQYTVFEQVKAMVLQHRKNQHRQLQMQQQQQQQYSNASLVPTTTLSSSLGAMESFFLGMLARVVATILVFPYVRAKVVLQTQKGTPSSTNSTSDNNHGSTAVVSTATTTTTTTSIPHMLWHMYQHDGGIASWFQGIGPELTRGMLSAALMLMIKEQLYTVVDQALYGTPKTTTTTTTSSSNE